MSTLSQLTRYAGRQGVLGLVCDAVASHAAAECKRDVLDTLRDIHKSLAADNMRKLAALHTISRALEKAGIEMATFKGISTAQLAYGDITLRACGDLDILVPEDKVEQSRDILRQLGYSPNYDFSDFQRRKLHSVIHAETFYSEDRSIMVELHWSLSSSEFWAPIENLRYLEDCSRVDVQHLSLRTFNPEKLFIYLCFHGQRHAWSALFWLVDISRIIDSNLHDDSFWNSVLALARKGEVETMVLSSVLLCREILGTPLPRQAASYIEQRPAIARITSTIQQEMQEQLNDVDREGPPRHRAFSVNQMRLLPGLKKKLKYLVSIARIQEADYAVLDLPRWLHFVYYMLRPLNVASRKLKPQA